MSNKSSRFKGTTNYGRGKGKDQSGKLAARRKGGRKGGALSGARTQERDFSAPERRKKRREFEGRTRAGERERETGRYQRTF